MLLRVLRWWLPWLLAFGVSSALAYAADGAITARTVPVEVSDTREPPGHWMHVMSTSPDGQAFSVLCHLPPSLISVDEVVLAWNDVHEFVSEACDQVRTDRTD